MNSYILTNLEIVYNIINQIDKNKITSNFDFSSISIDNDLGSIVVYIEEKIITIKIKDKGLMNINIDSFHCQDEVDKFNKILIISHKVLEKQRQQFINDFKQGLLDFQNSLNL